MHRHLPRANGKRGCAHLREWGACNKLEGKQQIAGKQQTPGKQQTSGKQQILGKQQIQQVHIDRPITDSHPHAKQASLHDTGNNPTTAYNFDGNRNGRDEQDDRELEHFHKGVALNEQKCHRDATERERQRQEHYHDTHQDLLKVAQLAGCALDHLRRLAEKCVGPRKL